MDGKFANEQEKRQPGDHPEEGRIDSGNPQVFTGQSISLRDNIFQNRRLDNPHITQGNCLAASGFRDVRDILVIYPAGFQGREQLAGACKIQRWIFQIKHAQSKARQQDDCQGTFPEPGTAKDIHPHLVYFHINSSLTRNLKYLDRTDRSQ